MQNTISQCNFAFTDKTELQIYACVNIEQAWSEWLDRIDVVGGGMARFAGAGGKVSLWRKGIVNFSDEYLLS